MSQWHGGKGSSRRNEDAEKIRDNWDKIFGRKPKVEDFPENKKTKEEPLGKPLKDEPLKDEEHD